MAHVAYISYDGMAEQLGQAQVLPYVRGLAARGHTFDLISFEKPGTPLTFREPIADGVRWTALRYHQTPTVPATSFDLTQGALTIGALSLFARADFLHVRSYVPCVMALPWARVFRRPILFDTRGTWPDQKVASGTWSADGRLYLGTKRIERVLYRDADVITTLTNALATYLRDEYPHRREINAPIVVIPTCVDLDRFTLDVIPALPDAKVKTLVYVGSLGGIYRDVDVARFYLAWRRHAGAARLLVVSRQTPTVIREALGDAANELVHRAASHDEVPALLRSADAAVSLINDGFGFVGSAPTKIGEMLACGIPVAATALGDVGALLARGDAGFVVDALDDAAIDAAAARLLALATDSSTAKSARALAERWFSLDRAIDSYDQIYRHMPPRHGTRATLGDHAWPIGAD